MVLNRDVGCAPQWKWRYLYRKRRQCINTRPCELLGRALGRWRFSKERLFHWFRDAHTCLSALLKQSLMNQTHMRKYQMRNFTTKLVCTIQLEWDSQSTGLRSTVPVCISVWCGEPVVLHQLGHGHGTGLWVPALEGNNSEEMQEIPEIYYKTKGFPSFLTWGPDTNPCTSKKPKYVCPGLTWHGATEAGRDMVLSTAALWSQTRVSCNQSPDLPQPPQEVNDH